MRTLILSSVLALALGPGVGAAQEPPLELSSPDGRLRVEVRLPDAGGDGRPTWSASFRDEPLLADCRLGLLPVDGADLLAGASLVDAVARSHDERIVVRFGRADHASDRFAELRVTLQRTGALPVDVVWRCYDDAVALRYELPRAKELLSLRAEGTSFRLVGDPTAYVQILENDRTSHEHHVTTSSWAGIVEEQLIDLPATFAWADGTVASITEAALRHYAGMSLWRARGEPELVARLTPRPDGLCVVRPLPMVTPWRVVLVGDRAGALLESDTLYCLNDPPEAGDLDWIRPGKMTWPWWNGALVESRPTDPILSLAANQRYIDFCASHGIAFHAVVADEEQTPWYVQPNKGLFPGAGTDATRPREGLELEAIHAYAQERGVRLWTWVHQGAVRGHVEAVFEALERLGFAGVMVDFLDHDDQDTVEFAEEVLRAGLRHHVLVHFHGMYKPTGWQRTFPNLMNHEGALNLEYLKWSADCTPAHDLLIAFTRLVAGPVDYHLGGFRAVPASEFEPHFVAPNVLGTRCHQLALYVCFDNPNPMVADYPAAYRDQPGLDFLVAVPTWWDETRVVQAEIGRWLLTARRRGREWWLGGLGAGAPRSVALPLTFLGDGDWQLRLWRDAPHSAEDPDRLVIESARVSADDVLEVEVAVDGGFVARLAPGGE